jgi:hypothetical protein
MDEEKKCDDHRVCRGVSGGFGAAPGHKKVVFWPKRQAETHFLRKDMSRIPFEE